MWLRLSCDNKEDGGRKFSQSTGKQRGLEFKQTGSIGSIGFIGFTGSVSTAAMNLDIFKKMNFDRGLFGYIAR